MLKRLASQSTMNLKKNKSIFISLLLIALLGFSGYLYIYKSHKNIKSAAVNYNGNSNEFLEKIKTNQAFWIDKTIILRGTITQVEKNGIVLDELVYCQIIDVENRQLAKQTQITIKGTMTGYDDLLEEVKLTPCIILK